MLRGCHLEGEATWGCWESSWLLGFGSRGSNTLTSPLDKLSGDELFLFELGLEGILGVLGNQKGWGDQNLTRVAGAVRGLGRCRIGYCFSCSGVGIAHCPSLSFSAPISLLFSMKMIESNSFLFRRIVSQFFC